MFLTNLFNFKKTCNHEKINPDLDFGYCPDCGKLVKNEWYVTRCSCCGVKMRAIIKGEEILPQNNFCINCGCHDFYIEKLEKINFIDINFAVLKRQVVESDTHIANTTQCWQEKTPLQPKLLVQYL